MPVKQNTILGQTGTGDIHPLVLEFCHAENIQLEQADLLQAALTHPTYAFEQKVKTTDYERLEFLGDAVLELVVSDLLYKHKSCLPEGQMTKIRASLVREESLAELARLLNLGHYLLLGKGEEHTGGREKASNLANAYEAVLGALYLNWGFDLTKRWLSKKLEPFIEPALSGAFLADHKSLLLEAAQSIHVDPDLEFVVSKVDGPDHDPVFEANIYYKSNLVARGRGHSKKQAEQEAAREALALDSLFSESK